MTEILSGAVFMLLSLVPFLLIGVVLVFVLRSQDRRRKKWAEVARQLGLQAQGDQVWGYVDGHPVQMQIEMRGSGKNRHAWTVVNGLMTPPLDLGLYCYRKGFFDAALGELFGTNDIPVGDPVFDNAFIVRADEPHRVAAFLQPPLRQTLHTVISHGASASLSDTWAHIERSGAVSDPEWMVWSLRTVAVLGRLMEQARPAVPTASTLVHHRQAWEAFAHGHGLVGSSTPLCMWGELEGSPVWAYAVRTGHGLYELEVLVRYAQPLGCGLWVRPQKALDGFSTFFGGQDLQLQDPAFDSSFVVKAARADAVPRILDGNVRERAVSLLRRYVGVQIRDDGVAIRTVFPPDPGAVLALLQEARVLCRAVEENATRPAVLMMGPYR